MAIFLGTLDSDVIRGTDFIDIITGLSGSDLIFGGGGADIIEGGSGNDRIYAASTTDWRDDAVDTILAGSGDDEVFAAFGDILDGGIGLDSLWYDMSGADRGVVVDFRPTGIDLLAPILEIGNASVGGFEIVREVIGSGFDDEIRTANRDGVATRLDGAAGDDLLQAGSGDDILIGGIGADRMIGGGGNDTYFVDNRGDVVAERAGPGADRVVASINYELGDHVEALSLTGAAIVGRGNTLDNRIDGSDTDNVLSGLDGNDRLDGGGSDDRLVGGQGRDVLIGGTGADVFVFNEGDTGSTGLTADAIVDFSRAQGDMIDLGGVDAVVGGTDNAFAFIGSAAFSGTAGELRLQVNENGTFVFGDTDGDRIADLAIRVQDATNLIAADFIL